MNTIYQLIRFIGPEEDNGYKLNQLKQFVTYTVECERPPEFIEGNAPAKINYERTEPFKTRVAQEVIDIGSQPFGVLNQINNCFMNVNYGPIQYSDCLIEIPKGPQNLE